MFRDKTILVAPLDWGLGHASRCVPLIRGLLLNSNNVIVGCTQVNSSLVRYYFPSIKIVELPSYGIKYSAFLPQWLKVALQLPLILRKIRKEKKAVDQYVELLKIEVLISDNRYGVYSPETYSVFVTHQLRISATVFSDVLSAIHRRFFRRFDQIWVPDFEDINVSLAGKLSHTKAPGHDVVYLGPQSALAECDTVGTGTFDFLILLSGTEPQRSILENALLSAFAKLKARVALVRGVHSNVPLAPNNVTQIFEFAGGSLLRSLIINSRTVICRSGYSTLMDLHILGQSHFILIPTPGQPEQEYLADWWATKRGAKKLDQKKISALAFDHD